MQEKSGYLVSRVRTLGACLVGLLLLAVLLSFGKVSAYQQLFENVDRTRFAVSLLFVPIAQFLRAWRISLFVSGRNNAPTMGLFDLASAHMFFASVLPARAGELAMPVLLSRRFGMKISNGIGVLLLLRLYDLVVILIVSVVAAIFLIRREGVLEDWIGLGLAALLVLIVLVFVLPYVGSGILRRITGRIRNVRVLEIAENLGFATAMARKNKLCALIALTLLVWLVTLQMCVMAATAVIPDLAWSEGFIASALGVVAGSQPLNGVAGMGTFEGGIAAILSLSGYEWEVAIVTALVVHVAQITGVSLNAGAAHLLYRAGLTR